MWGPGRQTETRPRLATPRPPRAVRTQEEPLVPTTQTPGPQAPGSPAAALRGGKGGDRGGEKRTEGGAWEGLGSHPWGRGGTEHTHLPLTLLSARGLSSGWGGQHRARARQRDGRVVTTCPGGLKRSHSTPRPRFPHLSPWGANSIACSGQRWGRDEGEHGRC